MYKGLIYFSKKLLTKYFLSAGHFTPGAKTKKKNFKKKCMQRTKCDKTEIHSTKYSFV